eukprot:TRINITY_DN6873_c0_g1_i1.p1 TRINITY_DN6873_c0_g1~~TRINITY_DN6873_c0_g1_i1.p1  ORF type:complete len:503 (-),score=134.94 TRINITY_DN6873_c0_g1_i1:1526-2848(-)
MPYDQMPQFCKQNDVQLVVVGPEAPLAAGLSDILIAHGIPVFGPSKRAAEIEASKAFSKEFMARHNIPTAGFKVFTDFEAAKTYVQANFHSDLRKLVIKASGLAAGKGVVLPASLEEAIDTLKEFMIDKIFGDAGTTVVIEETLFGEEVSCLAITDGFSVVLCPAAQDHKRLRDGDLGPNTGGMGAYAPAPILTPELKQQVLDLIVKPAIAGLRKEGIPFVGVLYAGVMICPGLAVPTQTLEFNCRFGDPETQCVLPLLESDLFEIMYACAKHCLDSVEVKWAKPGTAAVTVVAASEGYPKKFIAAQVIDIKSPDDATSVVFHAGTSENEKKELLATGGRVLAVTGISEHGLRVALNKAYKRLSTIDFKGMQFRTDIAQKAFSSFTVDSLKQKASDAHLLQISRQVSHSSALSLGGGIVGAGAVKVLTVFLRCFDFSVVT